MSAHEENVQSFCFFQPLYSRISITPHLMSSHPASARSHIHLCTVWCSRVPTHRRRLLANHRVGRHRLLQRLPECPHGTPPSHPDMTGFWVVVPSGYNPQRPDPKMHWLEGCFPLRIVSMNRARGGGEGMRWWVSIPATQPTNPDKREAERPRNTFKWCLDFLSYHHRHHRRCIFKGPRENGWLSAPGRWWWEPSHTCCGSARRKDSACPERGLSMDWHLGSGME